MSLQSHSCTEVCETELIKPFHWLLLEIVLLYSVFKLDMSPKVLLHTLLRV